MKNCILSPSKLLLISSSLLLFIMSTTTLAATLYNNWNSESCSLTDTAEFKLSERSPIHNIRTWYNWRSNETSVIYKMFQRNVLIYKGSLTKGQCDPYQKNWCQGTVSVQLLLNAGAYRIEAASPRICKNSSSQNKGFISISSNQANGNNDTIPTPEPSTSSGNNSSTSYGYIKQGNLACFGQASYPSSWNKDAQCFAYGCNFGSLKSLNSCLALGKIKGAKEIIYGVAGGRTEECWLQSSCGDKRANNSFVNYVK